MCEVFLNFTRRTMVKHILCEIFVDIINGRVIKGMLDVSA